MSAAAHEHWITAPIANGTIEDTSAMPGVRFVVDAAKLTVVAGDNLSAKDLAEVQSNMQTKFSKRRNIQKSSSRQRVCNA